MNSLFWVPEPKESPLQFNVLIMVSKTILLLINPAKTNKYLPITAQKVYLPEQFLLHFNTMSNAKTIIIPNSNYAEEIQQFICSFNQQHNANLLFDFLQIEA